MGNRKVNVRGGGGGRRRRMRRRGLHSHGENEAFLRVKKTKKNRMKFLCEQKKKDSEDI
mgnify:FL=1